MEGTVAQAAPMIAIIALLSVGGWIFTTWLRVKHGYPLDGAWGQAIYPKASDEAMERIVTDDSHRLTQEIDALRIPRN